MQWFGKPVPITRFLGQIDQDDPTNLPSGIGSVCRNTEFARDNGGVTCATTRAGVNLAIQGINAAPITGIEEFVYQPQLPTEYSFERPVYFDLAGALQYENPLGTGRAVAFPATPGGFTPKPNTHMIGAVAGNKCWEAFSDLKKAASVPACIDPKKLTVWPLGMKPVGWRWTANTPVIAGEVCTPATPAEGNGHTYQAQNSGTTGANQPAFNAADPDGTIYNDNGIQWKELTMVMANRLPAPPAPVLTIVPGAGTFPANQTVFVLLTYTNSMGETIAGAVASITTTALNDAVQVTIPALASLPSWLAQLSPTYAIAGVNVYEADVPMASPAPVESAYKLSAASALGGTPVITAAAGGATVPTRNGARVTPGQLPTPTVGPDSVISPGAGAFPAGRDVYIRQTYVNYIGETKVGPAAQILNTNLNDGVQVTCAVPEDADGNALYDIVNVGLYEADVPTGTPAPPISAFREVGHFAIGSTPVITAAAVGSNAPTTNTTGPGGAIGRDTSDGGVNGSQGYRYASLTFFNQNESQSGFTAASVIKYDVDEDGWELAVFNVPTGPANIIGRVVQFTGADGVSTGPFKWIGTVNIIVPSENFVYPQTEQVGDANYTATVILDNVTTQAIFNFDDTFLDSENDATDRLQVIAPPPAARVDYLESVQCLALSGVDGLNGGGLFSISTDYESFRGDLGPVPISANGEVCYGFTDKYKGIIFAIRSASGYAITPSTGAASGWAAKRRWGGEGPSQGVGACGYRAWAACSKFIILVNRMGVYKYDEGDDDLMSKEIPRSWAKINWAYGHTIECYIDEETKQVLIAVPMGNSTAPNQVIAISYLEGWQNPLHFSPYSGKEVAMDAARRYSFQDIQANVIKRVNRTLPPGPAFVDGPDWNTIPDSSFGLTQLLFGSSGPDGGIHARTPGIYSDNGAGIDWRYRTVSAGQMQAVCKPEGFNLNAVGNGVITAWFYAARDMSDGSGGKSKGIRLREFALTPDQSSGITRKCPPKMNEYWSVEFSNNKQPDVWCSLKNLTVYVIPVTGGRGELDKGN